MSWRRRNPDSPLSRRQGKNGLDPGLSFLLWDCFLFLDDVGALVSGTGGGGAGLACLEARISCLALICAAFISSGVMYCV